MPKNLVELSSLELHLSPKLGQPWLLSRRGQSCPRRSFHRSKDASRLIEHSSSPAAAAAAAAKRHRRRQSVNHPGISEPRHVLQPPLPPPTPTRNLRFLRNGIWAPNFFSCSKFALSLFRGNSSASASDLIRIFGGFVRFRRKLIDVASVDVVGWSVF